jgi:hypothetical protein
MSVHVAIKHALEDDPITVLELVWRTLDHLEAVLSIKPVDAFVLGVGSQAHAFVLLLGDAVTDGFEQRRAVSLLLVVRVDSKFGQIDTLAAGDVDGVADWFRSGRPNRMVVRGRDDDTGKQPFDRYREEFGTGFCESGLLYLTHRLQVARLSRPNSTHNENPKTIAMAPPKMAAESVARKFTP